MGHRQPIVQILLFVLVCATANTVQGQFNPKFQYAPPSRLYHGANTDFIFPGEIASKRHERTPDSPEVSTIRSSSPFQPDYSFKTSLGISLPFQLHRRVLLVWKLWIWCILNAVAFLRISLIVLHSNALLCLWRRQQQKINIEWRFIWKTFTRSKCHSQTCEMRLIDPNEAGMPLIFLTRNMKSDSCTCTFVSISCQGAPHVIDRNCNNGRICFLTIILILMSHRWMDKQPQVQISHVSKLAVNQKKFNVGDIPITARFQLPLETHLIHSLHIHRTHIITISKIENESQKSTS